MTLTQQLNQALIHAPLSLRYLKRQSIRWMLIYLACGLVLFSLFTWTLLENQDAIKDTILDYLFPESWHGLSELLGDFLFESQAKIVLGNLIISGSLVFASIFLFPVKEKFSAVFEKNGQYKNGSCKEFPLLYQAWEETKLLLIYLTAQSVILWIGYYPYLWANILSIILSYLFVFFSFGLDFISPTLQRHRISYTHLLKVLLQKPVITSAFGLLFSLPVIIISHFIFKIETLSLIEISSILFLTNIIFLTLAIPAGTHIASQLIPEIRNTKPPKKKNKIRAYSSVLILLIGMSFLHGGLIASLHHKSQLLKAEYEVDWSSIDYELPSISQFLSGKALSNLSFNVEINNPTEYDIIIENSKIFVEKTSHIIAEIDLDGFEVPSGQLRKVKINVDTTSQISQITDYKKILENWRVDLHLQLWPGIPFIVNLSE